LSLVGLADLALALAPDDASRFAAFDFALIDALLFDAAPRALGSGGGPGDRRPDPPDLLALPELAGLGELEIDGGIGLLAGVFAGVEKPGADVAAAGSFVVLAGGAGCFGGDCCLGGVCCLGEAGRCGGAGFLIAGAAGALALAADAAGASPDVGFCTLLLTSSPLDRTAGATATAACQPGGGDTCTKLPHFGQSRISPIAVSSCTFSRARQVVHSIVKSATATAFGSDLRSEA
jgi:hypothetical protein